MPVHTDLEIELAGALADMLDATGAAAEPGDLERARDDAHKALAEFRGEAPMPEPPIEEPKP